MFVAATCCFCSLDTAVAQLPTGGNVAAGQAVISANGNGLNVTALSDRSVINWNSFQIGAGNSANFQLPGSNSAILNRVTTPGLPSTINGLLTSNGNVFLINPSGVVVGQSGIINTNGFTASTFDVMDSQFMEGGDLTFSDNGSEAGITNLGSITTGTGGAHLIASQLENKGLISSNGGNITLASGGSVTLKNGITYIQPSLDVLKNGVSPTANLIKNSGTIRATGAAVSGGEVYLVNPNGKILHDGTITANKRVDSQQTVGGKVQLEANEITLEENSKIDVSGTHAGGEVLVGGDWQGSGDMTQATSVTMKSTAEINASATENGDGGKIVLWSDTKKADSQTTANGTLLARGGAGGGDGGQIETSAANINTDEINVDASAPNGNGGLWLIDPYNYNIDGTAAGNIVSALNSGTSVTITTTANNSSYGSQGSGDGNILVSHDIITGPMSGNATLTLRAHRRVQVNAEIDASQNSNTRRLNVVLWSDYDNTDDAGVSITRTISTNGGHLWAGGSRTNSGTSLWNGLQVGDGPSIGAFGGNHNGLDLFANISTGGGDAYFWAGNGVANGLHTDGSRTVSTGSGDFTIIADQVVGNITLNSTGHFTFEPFNNTFEGVGGELSFISSVSGNTFSGTGDTDWLTINNYNSLSGLTLGKAGMGSHLRIHNPIDINGPIFLFANHVLIDSGANLNARGSDGRIQISGYDDITVNAGSVSATGSLGFYSRGILTLRSDLSSNFVILSSDTLSLPTAIDLNNPGGLTIQPHGSSFSSSLNWPLNNLNINGSLSHLTLGKTSNASNLTIAGNQTVGGDINLFGGNVAINGRLTSTGSNTITIGATGNVTDGPSGYVQAENLLVRSGGLTSLDHNSMTFQNFAFDGGSVDVQKQTSFTVGTVDGTVGIDASGTVNLSTESGDITVAEDIRTTDSSSSAINLNAGRSAAAGDATGGNILISGNPTISTGTGGRATLQTGSISGSTGFGDLVGTGSSRFRYNSDESTTNFTMALGSGLHGIYREQPTVSTDLNDLNTEYGSLPLTFNTSGVVNGDTLDQIFSSTSFNIAGGVSSSGNPTVGSHTVTSTFGAEQLGYAVGSINNTANLTVTPKNITISGITSSNRIYDGTTNAAVDTSGVSFGGLVAGDDVSISGTTGSFADKHVENGKTISLSEQVYGGSDAGNYTFTDQNTTTADITPKALTISGITAGNRVYDGSISATTDIDSTIFDGLVDGDDVTVSSTGAFSDKTAGNGRVVNLTNVFGGSDAGNYTIADQTTTTADIFLRTLTLSGITAGSKAYDGNTSSTLNFSGLQLDGLVAGDNVTVGGAGFFSDRHVGEGKLVTLSLTYGGTDFGNYNFIPQENPHADITRLSSVTWTGGASGNWSDPANWAGGAIPDLSNVANVIIPGGVTPIFDNSVTGPVSIDSLTGGNFQMDSGVLNVENDVTTDTLAQNGGQLNVGGNVGTAALHQTNGILDVSGSLTVTQDFEQSPDGHITAGGNISIHQAAGDLKVENLNGGNIDLNASGGSVSVGNVNTANDLDIDAGNGNVSQKGGTKITVGGTTSVTAQHGGTPGDIRLDGSGNEFQGPVNLDGKDVSIVDSTGGLTLGEIISTGNLNAESLGGTITQTPGGRVAVGGETTLVAKGENGSTDVILDNAQNIFGGKVNVDGDEVFIESSLGEIEFGNVRSTSFEQNGSRIVRDVLTRYEKERRRRITLLAGPFQSFNDWLNQVFWASK